MPPDPQLSAAAELADLMQQTQISREDTTPDEHPAAHINIRFCAFSILCFHVKKNKWKDMRDKDILYLLIRGRPVYLIRVTYWRDE